MRLWRAQGTGGALLQGSGARGGQRWQTGLQLGGPEGCGGGPW